MTEPFHKGKDFLKLRWEWYEKLKKDGKFTDIEYFDTVSGEALPQMDGMSRVDIKKSVLRWGNSRAEYYRLAEHHKRRLSYRFNRSSWQVKAWDMHASGIGVKTIASAVGERMSIVLKFIKKEAKLSLRALSKDT